MQVESAGQAPPQNRINLRLDTVEKSKKAAKINQLESEGAFKLKQGVQEVGDNDNMDKLLE